MNHGGHDEGIAVVAGLQHVALLDDLHGGRYVEGKVLGHHVGGLLVAHHPDTGIAANHLLNGGGVVRLHMLHHQVVQLPTGKHMLHILKKHLIHAVIHRIKQHGLVVQQQIGVVGHAMRHVVHALKYGQTAVVAAHPGQIIGHFSYAVHGRSLLSVCAVIIRDSVSNVNKIIIVIKIISNTYRTQSANAPTVGDGHDPPGGRHRN